MDSFLRAIKLRWGLYLPFALLTVLAAGYSVYWIVLSHDVENRIERWAELQRAQGLDIQYDDLLISGYPYRFDIHMTNVVLGDPAHANAWSWSIEEVVAITLPYRLNQILVEINGTQKFNYQERVTNGTREPRQFRVNSSAERWRASFVLAGASLKRLSLDLEVLKAIRAGAPDTPETITADRIQLHAQFQPISLGGSKLYMNSQNMSLPPLRGLEDMQGPIEIAELEFELDESIEKMLDRIALQTWIDGGGTINVSKMRVLWDGVDVSGDGQVTFDEQARPAGTINTLIGGHDRLVDKLIEAQTISENDAGLIRSALTLLAIAGGDSQGRVRTQVKIENGEIFVGPAKLGRVGPIRLN